MQDDHNHIAQSATANIPKHVAIIMDGNGRWAQNKGSPRITGHKAGVETVRSVIQTCAEKGIEVLTLFAFSSENWRRPKKEVSLLMTLFLTALQREVKKLHKNGVCLRIVGDVSAFDSACRASSSDLLGTVAVPSTGSVFFFFFFLRFFLGCGAAVAAAR